MKIYNINMKFKLKPKRSTIPESSRNMYNNHINELTTEN